MAASVLAAGLFLALASASTDLCPVGVADPGVAIAQAESGSRLKQLVEDSSAAFIYLRVVNGTRWLNLGGRLDDFGPVLGRPPQTSSDMKLEDALRLMEKVSSSMKEFSHTVTF